MDSRDGLLARMDPSGVISAIFAGIIIGIIARILVPSMQPIGCIVTIIIGIVGAFLGLAVANWLNYEETWIFVFLTQVLIATVLVAITAALFRKSSTG
jgi:uncharacterized membrane protein YeaQ/YmgE (transglycosylase-associated protein family)